MSTIRDAAASSRREAGSSGGGLRDVLRDKFILLEAYSRGDDTGDAVENPATGETIAFVPRMDAQQAEGVITRAAAAAPGWLARTARERADVLKNWASQLRANKDDLSRILTCEQGKPLREAEVEIERSASYIEFFAEEGKRLYGETIPSYSNDVRILVTPQPIGLVAAITPWNFPASMVARKVGPALAAGCPVVLKPAPETPLTALAMVRLGWRAGVPTDALAVLTGDGPTIGGVLTRHPSVKYVSFTGSTAVGRTIMEQAASTIKKVGLELGGNAPFIVFDDADLDAAVEGVIAAKFRNMGQTCISANRIYVQEAVHDQFVAKLSSRVERLTIGNGLDPNVDQGPLIKEAAVTRIERHIEEAVSGGAKVVAGGGRHSLGGTFFEPTVICGATAKMSIATEEIFGPVAVVYRFSDEKQVVESANASKYGLAAYLYSRDIGRIFRVSEALECGMVGVNAGSIGSEAAPFGGVKESGIGREGSRHGLMEFVELKAVFLSGISA